MNFGLTFKASLHSSGFTSSGIPQSSSPVVFLGRETILNTSLSGKPGYPGQPWASPTSSASVIGSEASTEEGKADCAVWVRFCGKSALAAGAGEVAEAGGEIRRLFDEGSDAAADAETDDEGFGMEDAGVDLGILRMPLGVFRGGLRPGTSVTELKACVEE